MPYPEVSGYFIPTLLNWGMRDLAVQYAKWLCSIQHENGAWYDALDKDPYIFDTAQILKGLIAVSDILPEAEAPIIKGCDWLIGNIKEDRRLPFISITMIDTSISNELIHIYCLSPLRNAAKKYDKPQYETKAKQVLEYYKSNRLSDILDFNILSHFYAYIIEGLIDLGEIELAKQAMEKISVLQNKNGSIPAFKDVEWICSTGLFQFALIYYKLGDKERGDAAFDYAVGLQNHSGGWYGSYPASYPANMAFGLFFKKHKPNYEPRAEISWAVKYFLDAYQYKLLVYFENDSLEFYDAIDKNDARYVLLKNSIVNTPPPRTHGHRESS
ncbi:hypothetical protein FACS1894147_11280 [Spirochaetia bacterium]|nr:hypothetical protein FACS1894147_11280 [Spirochaetia bacterium]